MRVPFIAGIASAALGTIAVGGGAATTTLNSTPAANLLPRPAHTATAGTPTQHVCDDGSWLGPNGINVSGAPDNLDPGDHGAVYVWHDGDGWHVRTTDADNVAHHYTGSIRLSPGASFTYVKPVRDEKDDSVTVTDNVLHYSLVTYTGVDGFDFRVSACDGSRRYERMHFSMDFNGREDDPSRIRLGDSKVSPPAASFTVRRVL